MSAHGCRTLLALWLWASLAACGGSTDDTTVDPLADIVSRDVVAVDILPDLPAHDSAKADVPDDVPPDMLDTLPRDTTPDLAADTGGDVDWMGQPFLEAVDDFEEGDGSAAAPYIVSTPCELRLRLWTALDGEVATSEETIWTVQGAPDVTPWEEHVRLTLPDGFSGPFSVRAVYFGRPSDPLALSFEARPEAPPNRTPEAHLVAAPAFIWAGDEVTLDASLSRDPDGDALTFAWDFDGDGVWDEEGGADPVVVHTYDAPSTWLPHVEVRDPEGLAAVAWAAVEVGDPSEGAWHSATVAADEPAGYWSALAEVAGHPAIAYTAQPENADGPAESLRFARADDAVGEAWAAPVPIDTPGVGDRAGAGVHLVVVAGNPAVCYVRQSGALSTVVYRRAADPEGSDWSAPSVRLDNAEGGADGCSLAVVDGLPSVAWHADGGGLGLTRALDPEGSAWATPILLDAGPADGDGGRWPALAVVDGHPAVAWQETPDDVWQASTVRYARATTADGADAGDWPAPVTVASRQNFGEDVHLAVLDGAPVVVVRDGDQRVTLYRSADPRGAAWDTGWGVTDTSDETYILWLAFAIVGDEAAAVIVADSLWSSDLRVARSATADGRSWSGPDTVDTLGMSWGHPALAALHGRPAVAYQAERSTGGDITDALRFAVFR